MAYGLDNFSIITIELQPKQNSWENPQEIFESMNSIGKPLSLADLVRNYLLLGLDADTQDRLYKKYWLKIEKTLPKQISFFIRDYMQGMKARPFKQATDTNYKELYSQFKTFFSNINAEELLIDLAKYAEIYAYISQEHNTGNALIDRELHDLRLINVSTAYSFLMILLNEWKEMKLSDKDLADILQAFKIYCYRRRILGITKGENKRFPSLVDNIQELEGSEDKKAAMFNILSQQDSNMRLPNDIEMKRAFDVMDFYSFKYCKLFLALIEESLTKSRPELSDPILQIEHIMPRNLNDKWKSDLGEDYEQIHQTYVNTIGNLTLIRHNQELGNKEFSLKKDVYVNNAGLQIAKSMITDCDKWNEETIHRRCEWLIDILLQKVLPVPEAMKKTNNFISKEGKHLSFLELQLIGNDINFIADPSISAHVVSDNEVEFEGKKWRLSPLTRELYTRKGTVNKSGAYQGSQYWSYDGIKLADII